MSMISAQCVKLREMASQLQEHGTFVGFGGTTSTDPLMLKSATLLREAADTIWELRCKLSDMVDERERLRSVVSDGADNARELRAENAKLRELCAELLRMAESNDLDFLHWPELHDELRKLGVDE